MGWLANVRVSVVYALADDCEEIARPQWRGLLSGHGRQVQRYCIGVTRSGRSVCMYVCMYVCMGLLITSTLYVCMCIQQLLKSWYTTPRHPEEAEPPRIVAVTDTTGMHRILQWMFQHAYIHTHNTIVHTAHVSWVAPPSFNLEACAFHMQYRIGLREKWYIHTYIHAYIHSFRT